jgi:hypothetical protein
MPTQLGTAVNFAFGSAAGLTLTSPTITGILLQSAEHGLESELATVRDGDGTTCTDIYYDQRGTASFVFKVSGSGIAAARTNTTLAAYPPGTILIIATCAARPDLVQTNWVVTEAGPKVSGGNADVAEITVPIRRRAGITAAASA